MSGFLSFVAACLAGLVGLFASGWAASLHAGWHQMSNREGAVGFFVIFIALIGGVVAFLLGLIVARTVASAPDPTFWKAAGSGIAAVAALVALAIGLSRLTADLPPTLDGKELVLEVEFRLAEGAPRPDLASGSAAFELRSVVNGVAANWERGSFSPPDEIREEEGRLILPARVPLFSRRGLRMIDGKVGEQVIGRFVVPLPSKPEQKDLEWSEWMPQARAGEAPWPTTETSYRYRVQPVPPAAPAP